MKLSVHLTFNGQCEAAFRFYERCLGGKIVTMLTYGNSPMAAQTPIELREKIVHATLILGDNTLAGVDIVDKEYDPAKGFFVLLDINDPREAERVFGALSENGTVQMPLQETFWATHFGVVVDQFGTPWEINSGRAGSEVKDDSSRRFLTSLDPHPDDTIAAFVKRLLPSVIVEPDAKAEPVTDGPSYHIHLPLPAGAEYRFTLWLGGGEKQITASLLGAHEATYFWHMPFEQAGFPSKEQLNKAFLDAVNLIVHHNTRIEQIRGLFSNAFKCEYESADGWKRMAGVSALRWINAPKIAERKRLYRSPALFPST